MRIYKYPLEITDHQQLDIPVFGHCIHVGLDPTGAPCVWFAVNTALEEAKRDVFIIGTGNPMPEGAIVHVGSFALNRCVWHVYLERN